MSARGTLNYSSLIFAARITFPDARLVTIDDGHLFLVTSADKSAEIISEFLR